MGDRNVRDGVVDALRASARAGIPRLSLREIESRTRGNAALVRSTVRTMADSGELSSRPRAGRGGGTEYELNEAAVAAEAARLAPVLVAGPSASEVASVSSDALVHRLRSSLHPVQLAMLDADGRQKAAVCGRRAGKTWVACVQLLIEALRVEQGTCVYLSLTAKQARLTLWATLLKVIRTIGIADVVETKHSTLEAVLPNGSKILCMGADDPRKLERLRGGGYSCVVVDEVGSFPRALCEYMIEDVLEPALLDAQGSLWLISTPSPACHGYFHDATNGGSKSVAAWPTWHWTARENPSIAHAATWIEAKRRAKGWDASHPTYRREWLGEWVRDDDALVYRYSREVNACESLPLEDVKHVVGVDLGASATRPTTAIAVLAYSTQRKRAWVVECQSMALVTPSDVARELQARVAHYHPSRVVVDAGALGAGYVEEFRTRYAIAAHPAEKRDKVANIDLMNGDLRTGRLQVLTSGCATLLDEWSVLQWNEDRDAVDDRTPDHCSDATLYAWRACKQWIQPDDLAEAEPEPGTEGWQELQRRAIVEERIKRVEREKQALARRRWGR